MEMQANDNDHVNEVCSCNASTLTLSRRVDPTRHDEKCFYRYFIERRTQAFRSEREH